MKPIEPLELLEPFELLQRTFAATIPFMKKISLLPIVLLISFFAIAQGPADYGIFVGGQMTNSHYYVRHVKQNTEAKYGFQLGAMAQVPFEKKLYFAPSAYYSLKGYKVKLTQPAFPPDSNAIDNNTTIHCFELAPLLQYRFGDKGGHFIIKAGPSLDFQFLGKEKFNLKNGGSVDRKMKFTFGDYGFVSANLLLHLGYETESGMLFTAFYSHGAGNISNADGGPSIKHRVFGVTIGKYFKRKKIVEDTRNRE